MSSGTDFFGVLFFFLLVSQLDLIFWLYERNINWTFANSTTRISNACTASGWIQFYPYIYNEARRSRGKAFSIGTCRRWIGIFQLLLLLLVVTMVW